MRRVKRMRSRVFPSQLVVCSALNCVVWHQNSVTFAYVKVKIIRKRITSAHDSGLQGAAMEYNHRLSISDLTV